MHCVISHHFISDNYCVTLTIHRLNISVASAKGCHCLACNSPPGTFTNKQIYKYKNIHNNIQPFHPNKYVRKLLGISKQFGEKKDSKQCFLGRIFYLEAKVLNIKWWKDLISNIDELIFSKQGFSIEQYHISFDLENPMKSSMWVDLEITRIILMTIIIRSVDLSPINDYNSDILFSVWPGLLRIITDKKNNSDNNYYPQCGLITRLG